MLLNRLSILLIGLIFISALSSCKKDELVVINNNTAPPDQSIADITIETYINRAYISLLGRKPLQAEYDTSFVKLRSSNLSANSRSEFLDLIFSQQEYLDKLYENARIDMLNNQDTNDYAFQMGVLISLLGNPAYQLLWDEITIEINRLEVLRMIPSKMYSGNMNAADMYRTCADNFYYDQINMGSLNFVVAVFQQFLDRYPTQSELQNGIDMVDGQNAILFFQSGQSKTDFLNIFFTSIDYHEGRVKHFYNKYVFRNPDSNEMYQLTQLYFNSKNIKDIQKSILSSNEYIGI
ncbi:MAG TPA: hypothetical protein PKH65_06965 [Bacteroidia bacterium]|nr:hypothetical protein [Bacteroidia bacterium]HNT80407.1 hypothetical protein [Bacteroidia bacterium]